MLEASAKILIDKLGLQPHPEGGFFRETYRSDEMIKAQELLPKFTGSRNYSTAIYFLLTTDTFSAFHRIVQDEIWHFYQGEPLIIHEIGPDGDYSRARLGSSSENGEVFQHVVKGGNYFAVEVASSLGFSLAGCTVAPGFDFADFEMPDRKTLAARFPQHSELIKQLTRN